MSRRPTRERGRKEAREHDAWFRGEVEQALREADHPAVRRIPNDDVRAVWCRQRATLVKRAEGKTAHGGG